MTVNLDIDLAPVFHDDDPRRRCRHDLYGYGKLKYHTGYHERQRVTSSHSTSMHQQYGTASITVTAFSGFEHRK